MFTPSFITFEDLVIAYRKAKADVYYERDHPGLLDFIHYEETLFPQLQVLHGKLLSRSPTWHRDPDIIGGYSYIPKAIEFSKSPGPNDVPQPSPGLAAVQSNPDVEWQQRLQAAESTGAYPKVHLRLVGSHPVAFHILSALWLMKVGVKYDAVMKPCAYGSRLRLAYGSGETDEPRMNEIATGSFTPYVRSFRAWRQRGLQAAWAALEAKEKVVVLTADLQQFYHRTSPDFLLHPRFLAQAGIVLTPDEEVFTRLFIKALHFWASRTPEHQEKPERGLPVGLSAARLIANCALRPFDEVVRQKLAPRFYGRYVDDIFLLLGNDGPWERPEEVWEHVCQATGVVKENQIPSSGPQTQETLFQLNLPGHEASLLQFSGTKQKIFFLEGDTGRMLLEAVERHVNSRSSEWRLLPDLPERPDDLAQDFLAAHLDTRDEADNLRKADGLCVKRQGFAALLCNFEAVQADLPAHAWASHRAQFLDIVKRHILSLPHFFEYASYFPRLIGLTASTQEWPQVQSLLDRLDALFGSLRTLKGFTGAEALSRCRQHLRRRALEAILQALPIGSDPVEDPESCLALIANLQDALTPSCPLTPGASLASILELARRFHVSDLGRVPFRESLLLAAQAEEPPLPTMLIPHMVAEEELAIRLNLYGLEDFLCTSGLWPKNAEGLPFGLIFPTRAFRLSEVTAAHQPVLVNPAQLAMWMRALRGSSYQGGLVPSDLREPPELTYIQLSYPMASGIRVVAIPCLLTKESSWLASINQEPDPDCGQRYFRITRLINQILRSESSVDYVLLPELSLPRRWFNRLAYKLSLSRISLISGLEYLHRSPDQEAISQGIRGLVSNQVMASIITEFNGFVAPVSLVQEKARPSQHEEKRLWEPLHLIHAPRFPGRRGPRKYLIQHGGFIFGILICSEFTNAEFQHQYRGKVDAVMVPEWNSDLRTFSHLIAAAAFDIHCFMIQVNNREFGDCRVRGPYSKEWMQDVVRIRGGEDDYFVIAKIPFHDLRRGQNPLSPPSLHFKPTPDGFQLSPRRWMLVTRQIMSDRDDTF